MTHGAPIDLARRRLLTGAAAAPALLLPRIGSARANARVVVVGGGFGGATCARALRALLPQARITLIEPRAHFHTGPNTNAALAGLCAQGDIVRGPGALVGENIHWIAQAAVALDPVRREVTTADGARHAADRVVLSPGVAMRWDVIEGLDAARSTHMPHAWLGDTQVPQLHARIAVLRDGATVAISAPANPYRCPPGPYERASLIAWHLQRTRRTRCKILVLDAKDDFSKRALFQLGWDTRYADMIEWVSRSAGGEVRGVDPARGTLHLHGGSRVRADLASVIPPQRAADLAQQADLCDETGWCPVHPHSFESLRHAGVHVVGDASAAHPMPKSAFSAHSQAQLAAASIAAALLGTPAPQPVLVNTCYSLLAPDHAISVGGLYGVVSGRLSALNEGTSPLAASAEWRAREAAYARDWYRNITHAAFGT